MAPQPAADADTGSSSSSNGGCDRRPSAAPSRRPVVAGEAPPRLNVGVFSKHKGVRYGRDGQVRSCRFCEILRTRAEEFLFEDEHVVVFRPLRPIVPSHVLIVPRAHIRNVNQLARQHRALLLRMKPVADAVVAKHAAGRRRLRRGDGGDGIGDTADRPDGDDDDDDDKRAVRVRASFHVPPFNSIDHVHMHAFVDDEATLGVYGRLKYRTESWWCRSFDDVLARLDDDKPTRDEDEDEDDGARGGFPRSPAIDSQPRPLPLTA